MPKIKVSNPSNGIAPLEFEADTLSGLVRKALAWSDIPETLYPVLTDMLTKKKVFEFSGYRIELVDEASETAPKDAGGSLVETLHDFVSNISSAFTDVVSGYEKAEDTAVTGSNDHPAAEVCEQAFCSSDESNLADPACTEEFEEQEPVYLYVLMRSDCPDLNPGKAVAQGTHAANQMVKEGRQMGFDHLIDQWEAETGDGFGTCIVVSATYPQLEQTVALAQYHGLHAGITHDPEYPLRDGHKMHFLPVDTCGYVFGTRSACRPLMKQFDLMA